MKKNVLLLIFTTFFSLAASDYSIVFVHCGPQLPSFLKYSLEQARLFNKCADIYLIADRTAQFPEHSSNEIFKSDNIIRIYCQDLQKSRAHQAFLNKSPLDKKFWNGFWLKATERLFYVEEFLKSYNIKNAFHMENDVMLYVDLHEFMPNFESFHEMAAIFDNDTRCIPSFMYFPQASHLSELVQFIADKAHLGKNDMDIIPLFWRKTNRSRPILLPIIMSDYVNSYPLKNQLNATPVDAAIYSRLCEKFNSIFDAAALGQYLGGIDPRIGKSSPGFINERCLFNPAHLTFEWKLDRLGRKVPFAQFNGKQYRINNLHIHSKKLYEFKS